MATRKTNQSVIDDTGLAHRVDQLQTATGTVDVSSLTQLEGTTAVLTTTAQTVGGQKTFSTMPIIPVATVAATGTVQADAAAVTTGFTKVTGADAAKGVKLPAAVAGSVVILKETQGAVLKVWPNTDDAINAIAANSNYVLAANTSAILIAFDATTWYSIPLLAS